MKLRLTAVLRSAHNIRIDFWKNARSPISFRRAPLYVVTGLSACLAISSCGKVNNITVNKVPMSVSTTYLEDLKDPSKVIKPDQEAITSWSFGCKTGISFDVIQKDLIDPEYMVTIRPKAIVVDLDAPVVIYISKKASKEVIDHENAHVAICKRVYKNAEAVAKDAANAVMDQTYQASGKSLEEACQNGVEKISKEVCEAYHMRTVESINRVSEVLDDLEEMMPNKSHDELVDQAFSKYVELSDKKQSD